MDEDEEKEEEEAGSGESKMERTPLMVPAANLWAL